MVGDISPQGCSLLSEERLLVLLLILITFAGDEIQLSIELQEFDNPDGLGPVRGMSKTGRGGPERVRGDVKFLYSAGEQPKAPAPNEP